MPNCFQLIRDGEAVSLNLVDEELCRHLDVPCDPRWYFAAWYDIIGFDLARGHGFAEIRRDLVNYDPIYAQIVDWLEANFTARSWYEPRSP